jgi:hypothetical protein
MALGTFMNVFQSRCVGVGYWTHFILGGAAGLLAVSPQKYARLWHTVFISALVVYQVLDYFYGTELMMTPEYALCRDLMEYFIGYALVRLGAYASSPRRESAQTQSLSRQALTTIASGAITFELSRVILEVILPGYFLSCLRLDRSAMSTLVSCRFFGSFIGMFATGPLTSLLSAPVVTSLGLALLGMIVGALSFCTGESTYYIVYIAMFMLGALASIISVGLNTTVQMNGSKDPVLANTVYRSFGLSAKTFVPSIASTISLLYTSAIDADQMSATIFVLRCLSFTAMFGASLLALSRWNEPNAEQDERGSKKRLSWKDIGSILTITIAYQPLFVFCAVLSAIASIEPIIKEGFLAEHMTRDYGMTITWYNSLHTFAGGTSLALLLAMRQQLKHSDVRSALFILSCIHTAGMVCLSLGRSSFSGACSYMLIRAATELAKIVAGMWTTQCAEGYCVQHGQKYPLAVVLASGLALQQMLGALFKSMFTLLVGNFLSNDTSLRVIFGVLAGIGAIVTYFMGQLPNIPVTRKSK